MPDSRLACLLVAGAMLISACSGTPAVDSAPESGAATARKLPPDAVPRREPKSRYGNPPFYEVLGTRYEVLDTSYGYQEQGVASWYGNKFHGRATSSQEPYDMYAMTAAHKSLPLPTYVRVRNLRNNRSVVVRVNDRGPFVDNRIIDLSYAAATKLDMVRDGTSLVEVTALSFDEPPPARQTTAVAEPPQDDVSAAAATGPEHEIFIQVGAFGDADNARRRYALLQESGIRDAFVHKDADGNPALYRIRIGPIAGVAEYDRLVERLSGLGVSEAHLVTD